MVIRQGRQREMVKQMERDMESGWKIKTSFIMRNIRAYPKLRNVFFEYLDGIEELPEGHRSSQLFWDYLKVRRTQPQSRVMISEYFIFAFYSLKIEQRLAYMTDYEAALYMRPYTEEAKPYLWNKALFLTTFSPYIHRDWLRVRDASFQEFSAFTRTHPTVAVKPLTSSWGIGFDRMDFHGEEDLRAVYDRLRKKDSLLEEYLVSDERLARFHPPSLNTVRIITFCDGEKFQVFGAGLRVGNNGKCVDNAHGGGIFCEIDADTGTIVTDGLDEWGNVYERHPVTQEAFRNFQIPQWKDMLDLCRRAGTCLPCLRIAGWDIALLKDGSLELIEGNHNPGMNIVQAPAKQGQKERFRALIREFFE